MDDIDRSILNTIQSDFPLEPRPYAVLGQKLGISEGEALGRVRGLQESGVIRKIGASFDTRRLGHVSCLVAAKVPPGRLDEVAKMVSGFPEVTHNYGRKADYNLWFTLVCENDARVDALLEHFKSATGVSEMHKLPAEKMFKIKVEFEF
jgi:siroheme decarboxylase